MAKAQKTFEEMMDELEGILETISDDDTPLDESIELYAKAAELIHLANQSLHKATVRIEEIDKALAEAEAGDDL